MMQKKMFTRAIVQKPGKSMINGLTTAGLGIPDYEKALIQHTNYIDALKNAEMEVIVLEADEDYPDACFVEDVAVCIPECAVLTNPGAPSRKGETSSMFEVLKKYYPEIHSITEPVTLEGGDVMFTGDTCYVGLSDRTNLAGAERLEEILKQYGYRTVFVELDEVLHLKTALAYLGNGYLLATDSFADEKLFSNFDIIRVPESELYAANCIRVNGLVIVPEGYPETRLLIQEAGFNTIEVDVSEFKKLDGGLSCLSLRF
jgi:dimethylargininase